MILDNVGNRPLRRLRRALTPTGTLVSNAGGSSGHLFGSIGANLRVVALNAVVGQRLRPLRVPGRRSTYSPLPGLSGRKAHPIVGRTYPLADTAAGLRYVEEGHARGKVVITVT